MRPRARLALLLWLVPLAPAYAADVYYSVGASFPSDLKSGSPTVTISAGTATFSVAQPDNVGVGDEVTYNGSTIAFISGRTSSTVYSVTTRLGAVPPNIGPVTVNLIRRAFASLNAANSGSSNAAHLNTTNLVTGGYQLHWPCYKDGPDTLNLTISAWTTGPANYIQIYTPTKSSEVGVSQRHRGIAGTGYRLAPVVTPGAGTYYVLEITNNGNIRIEGIEIDGTNITGGDGVYAIDIGNGTASDDIRISHCLIHSLTNSSAADASGRDVAGINLFSSVVSNNTKIWNNVIYDISNVANNGSSDAKGIRLSAAGMTHYIYNNTVYDIRKTGTGGDAMGIEDNGGVMAMNIRNNYVGNVRHTLGGTALCYNGPFASAANNVSSDATAPPPGNQTGKNAYSSYFEGITTGSENLHLKGTSAVLWGSAGVDLRADPNLPVLDDVDGEPRKPLQDIGADEFGCVVCTLTTSTPGSTITVDTDKVKLVWDAGNGGGGGLAELYGKSEANPAVNRSGDLDPYNVFSTQINDGATSADWKFEGYDNTGTGRPGSLRLLEATEVRAKLRQRYNYSGTVHLDRDWSVYGFPRVAINELLSFDVTQNLRGAQGLHPKGEAACGGANTFYCAGNSDATNRIWVATDNASAYSDMLLVANTAPFFGRGTAAPAWNNLLESPGTPNTWLSRVHESTAISTAAGTDRRFYLLYPYLAGLTAAGSEWQPYANDYRTASTAGTVTINGGKGSQWQDASEYSSAANDFFNEAESAYVANLDPALGLDLTLNGSAGTPRSRPFFKVRQWRSFVEAPGVTYDADGGGPIATVTLRKNVDYKAVLKPFSRGQYAITLSWHSTLESAAAATAGSQLDIGANGSPNTSGCPGAGNCVEFVAGRYGNGARFDANSDYVASAASTDINSGGGAVEFWYQPSYAHTDVGTHPLWYWQWGSSPDFHCYILEHQNQQLVFRVGVNHGDARCTISDGNSANYAITIGSGSYSWSANEWLHLRAEWKSGIPNYLRLYLNDALLGTAAFTPPGTSPLSTPSYIGGCSISCPGPGATSGHPAGIIDEFHVYSNNGTPVDTIGYAGLVADAREYLADGSAPRNWGLFGPKNDGFRRGRYLYLGADAKFRGVNVALASAGGGANPALRFEYWNAASWADLPTNATGFVDGTNNLKRTGTVSWDVEPGNWAPYSVNGGPDLYYLRVWLPNSSDDYAPAPVEAVIKTDILLFQYCGEVTTAAANFVFAPPATTEVELQSFLATAGDASVLVEWSTASELRNLGFHLYRSLSADGPWTRLTTSLIPGLGSSAVGQAYSFRDVGLANGTRYFYRLEDVDASSKTTSHGPVSALPQAAAAADGSGGGAGGGDEKKDAASSSCPESVVSAYASAVAADATTSSLRCTRQGNPEATSLELLSHDSRQATLELRTGGFYALHEPGGTVGVFVPGFDFPQEQRALALPLRRALVEAVVGRRVQLGGVRALDLVGYRGLVPSALGKPEMQVGWDGTVRALRRGTRSERAARGRARGAQAPGELVRLLPSVFQGETKSAVVELSPLRFDSQRRQLVLARRLRVRLLFNGRELGESGRGSVGRSPRPRQPVVSGELLARLHTTSLGLYTLAFEQLFPGRARGFPASELRLERQGEPVAFHLEPAASRFDPGSRLYFHAERTARSTDFSSELAYELLHAPGGVAMPLQTATAGASLVATASVVSRSFETNRFYQPGLLDAPDPWLWEALPSGATRLRSFTLSGVEASGTAELELLLQGASESGQALDHHLSVSLNGTPVGEAQFAGKRPYRMSLSLPATLLREGTNELQLTNVGDTGVTSLVFLDRFSVSHPQRASLASGRFEGTWSESGSVSLVGATGVPVVVDVTDSPRWLTGYSVTGGELRFAAEAGRRYLVVSPEALLSPRVGAVEPSTLSSAQNQADYLLIAPRAFLPAAEPLLQRRADQGLVTRAVAFEEIASEFGHGEPSAEAIRAFLGHAYQSWQRPSPSYVLLLGDASYDPRNFIGSSPPAPLPALWAKTSYLWTVSDPQLAAVNGEDPLPDLAIGRLPVGSLEQAQALVAKLLAWEDSGQGLAGAAALVADDPDVAGDFEADVEDIRASFLAERETRMIKLRELGPETRDAIREALDAGLGQIHYVGHGGAAVWASENVWNFLDAASLRAQSSQPLLVTMNCLNGYFVAPAFESLAESLLKAEGRGAIAAFSPSGLSVDGPAHQYHRALVAELVSGRHERLGDALMAAQQRYAASGLMPELLTIYHLFGDPATRIR